MAGTKARADERRGATLLVDAQEIAELLGTTRRHVLDLAGRDELPHVRIGRFVRFRRESIEQWACKAERWPNGGPR
jgi:excisionase family DNA binding protein